MSHDLVIFKQVAELQSVSKAAEKLRYAQTNISQRIKSLEEDFRVKLLIRSNRGATLTDEGNVLLEYANQITLLMNEAKSSVNPYKWRETLIIGAPQSISTVKIPELFSSFLKVMKFDSLESILQAIQDGLGISVLPEYIIHCRPNLQNIECQKPPESKQINFILRQHYRAFKG